MEKFQVDMDGVLTKLAAPKQIKLASIPQDKIEKVGFGVVRYTDETNKTGLWQIDGDSIVAMYEDDKNVNGNWAVESDKLNKSATVFYRNTPITNIKFAEVGIPMEEVVPFKRLLPERLANNKELVKTMLNSLDEKYREKLTHMYPELAK